MDETFAIAAFRSRQQVLRFEAALRRVGIKTEVITTPRDVSVGCGLSVRFELEDQEDVRAVYHQLRPTNLIGFYRVQRKNGMRPLVSPLG